MLNSPEQTRLVVLVAALMVLQMVMVVTDWVERDGNDLVQSFRNALVQFTTGRDVLQEYAANHGVQFNRARVNRQRSKLMLVEMWLQKRAVLELIWQILVIALFIPAILVIPLFW